MNGDFFKFPSTPHLALLGDVDVRNDKVLSETEREKFLEHELIVEEKVDGANLGISFDPNGNLRLQNRGAYLDLPGFGQWKKLEEWLAPRIDSLFECLTDRLILYGEWCYAQHSVFYDQLPDWFLGFDIYDKKAKHFRSVPARDALLERLSVHKVPFIAKGRFSLHDLVNLMGQSRLGSQLAEGLYLRVDQRARLQQRAKLVRPEFIQAITTHWSRSAMKTNRLR